ncbi:MAG: NAD(P)/FAD-dependent oxidoreductase, partial [Firmicutes bacterium]|nr:NAD(P)/FAD-dependent oxidoreductase [Bacillota bacterium]
LKRAGVETLRCRATGIIADENGVTAVMTENGAIECEAAALCTGGLSYPLTGSDGEGHKFAQALGHSVLTIC